MRATVALAGRTTVFPTDDAAGVGPETDVDDVAQAVFRAGTPAVGEARAGAGGGDVEVPDHTDDGEATDEAEGAATEEEIDEVRDRLKGLGSL